MDTQHDDNKGDRADQALQKKTYEAPVLLVLGSFSELTLTVGNRGSNDGGRQGGRRSTRA